MIVTCPACATGHEVPADMRAASGRLLRCSACGHRWLDAAASAAGGGTVTLLPRYDAQVVDMPEAPSREHADASGGSDAEVEATGAIPWATSERIHRAVKGWGWVEGEDEREHSFTCSKCHQPHASGLPRLMKTNCLDYTHRGQVEAGGSPTNNQDLSRENYPGRFPYGWWDNGVFENLSTGICHGADTANGPNGWPDNQRWNNVTPWEGGQ